MLEKFFIMSLAVIDKRRHHNGLFAGIFFDYQVDNFFFCIFDHFLSTFIGHSLSHPCIKQTQKIVNFRNRADCAPRIFVDSLLFDGYDRTQPRNFIHIRAFQYP